MLDTSRPASRILTALELLQNHPGITGPQLAERLDVSARTVRRYITTLQDMGVPVEPTTGRLGGYALRTGFRLPPMMFSSEEALGLAVALLATRPTQDAALPSGVASALAKIERLLPADLRERVESIREGVALPARDNLGTASFPNPGIVAQLAQACLMRRRIWFRYSRPDGDETAREVDPYGVCALYGRWYLHGWCYLRNATRTFRIDRIRRVDILPQTFELPDGLDVISAVQDSLALAPREHALEVHIEAPVDVVREYVPRSVALLDEMADGRTRLRASTSDLEWFSWRIATIPYPITVIGPDNLRDIFRLHAERLAAIASRQAPVDDHAP